MWPQVTPRPLVFALTLAAPFTFNMNSNFAALMGKEIAERREAYANASWRAKVMAEWEPILASPCRAGRPSTSRRAPRIPSSKGAWSASSRSERGVTPLDVLLDLALDEPDLALAGALHPRQRRRRRASRHLLSEPHCTLGLSDAGAHVGQLCDAPQATDLLGNWVRGRKAISLEMAIRKLSRRAGRHVRLRRPRLPARRDVGRRRRCSTPTPSRPGAIRRVRDFPANAERLTADNPTGVQHVLVNGTPIRADGQQVNTGLRPGRLVRPAARQLARGAQ